MMYVIYIYVSFILYFLTMDQMSTAIQKETVANSSAAPHLLANCFGSTQMNLLPLT